MNPETVVKDIRFIVSMQTSYACLKSWFIAQRLKCCPALISRKTFIAESAPFVFRIFLTFAQIRASSLTIAFDNLFAIAPFSFWF
jgi:hypothetical protein